jgi:hypothetical protein
MGIKSRSSIQQSVRCTNIVALHRPKPELKKEAKRLQVTFLSSSTGNIQSTAQNA